jgi:hypothetical protein
MPGSFEGHPENLAGYVEEGPIKTVKSVAKLASQLPPTAATPEERYKSGSDILQGAMTTLLPVAPLTAPAAPVATGVSLAAGYGTGKAAEKLTKVAGGSPEAQQFANDVGFFLPSALGTVSGLRTSIERVPGKGTAATASAFGDRVGVGFKNTPENFQAGVKVGGTKVGVDIPKTPPTAAQAEAAKTLNEATSALARRTATEQVAQAVTGSPLTPPPMAAAVAQAAQPKQTPISSGEVKPELLDSITQAIQSLPAEQRPAAMMEAHGKMAEALLQQGKVIGPDGKLYVIENEKQASKIAQQWMNDQVALADKKPRSEDRRRNQKPPRSRNFPQSAARKSPWSKNRARR